MPSKKQRAKKPGSKAALEKAAADKLRAELVAQQIAAADERAATDAKVRAARDERQQHKPLPATSPDPSSDGSPPHGGAPQIARKSVPPRSTTSVSKPPQCVVQTGNAANGVLNQGMLTLWDEVMTQTLDMGSRDGRMAGKDAESVAMAQLLKDNGLKTMPKEWQDPIVAPLLSECLQMRTKKIELARKQRARRRDNRIMFG